MTALLARVLRMAQPYRFRLSLGVLFGILAGLMEPVMVATIAIVYSIVFQDAALPASQVWWKQAPEWLQQWIIRIAASERASGVSVLFLAAIPIVFLLRGVVSYLNAYLMSWVSIRAVTDLRVRLFSHLVSLPASFFSGSRSGELMSRIVADIEMLRGTISNSVISLIKEPVTLISMLAFLLWQQPTLTAVSLVILPLCVVPIAVYGRKGRRAATTMQKDLAELSHGMMETFSGARIVKAYNLENAVIQHFRDTARRFIANYMRIVRATETPGPLLEFAGSVGVALLLAYAVHRSGPRPDGSAFLTLILAILTMYRPMKSLVRIHAQLGQAQGASQRVFELLDTESTLPEPAKPQPLKAGGADIRFADVSFSYEDKPVLRDVRLTVKPGSLVALVGPSGAGKTTLTNLLMRFYDPQQGAIYIGTTNIRDVLTRDLRAQIAVVTQETILFNDTIRSNIALGRPGSSEKEIVAAAKHAHAHDFIMEKTEGYNTIVGERGVALSGGQRQRLAIARAILKDAPILVLDEATSALDTESERAVQAALEELMAGRTTICIAHRLSTIQRADVIVVMSEGRIVETGAHKELIERGGLYHNLHKLQFSA
jgi:subfamily B ATP-binding cassette protein MsbA